MDRAGQGLALAAAGYGAWSLLSPGNALLLQVIGPLWMQASRTVLALVVVALWLRPTGVAASARLLARPGVLAALFFGSVASLALFSQAQTRIGPAETTLGFFAAPLWTAVLGRFFLGERVGPAFAAAALTLVLGGAMAMGVTDVPPDAWGVLLAVGSGITWAAYSVLLRRNAREDDWRHLVGASILLAAPVFLLLASAFEPMPAWSELPAFFWRWTIVQVAVPTLAAIACFQAALQRAPSAAVNLFVGIELVGAVAWSAWLLGERYSWVQIAGVAIVVAAVTGYVRWGQPVTSRQASV